ncbi:hypothetical protein GQ457_10G010680 [Hibiscus cannabinus]
MMWQLATCDFLSPSQHAVNFLMAGLTYLCFNLFNSGCEEAVLGLHHMRQKNQLHFKECMIQRLCENSMQKPARKRFSRRLKDHVFRHTHTQKPCDVFL